MQTLCINLQELLPWKQSSHSQALACLQVEYGWKCYKSRVNTAICIRVQAELELVTETNVTAHELIQPNW